MMDREVLRSGDVTITLRHEEGKVMSVNIDLGTFTQDSIERAVVALKAVADARTEIDNSQE